MTQAPPACQLPVWEETESTVVAGGATCSLFGGASDMVTASCKWIRYAAPFLRAIRSKNIKGEAMGQANAEFGGS